MQHIKTSTGTIILMYKEQKIDKLSFLYNNTVRGKDAIMKMWRHRYGEKYFLCQIIVEYDSTVEKVYINSKIRTRSRHKIPEYFKAQLNNFDLLELRKLSTLVETTIQERSKFFPRHLLKKIS